jgi:predicted secreted protein
MSRVEVPAAGSQVEVAVSDEVVIRLTEDATTGYQWSLEGVPSEVEIVSNQLDLAEKSAPGAAGQRVVVLRAVRPGTTAVRLVNSRTWESGPPREEFGFLLTVR